MSRPLRANNAVGNVPELHYAPEATATTKHTKKRGPGKEWQLVREFANEEEADTIAKSTEWKVLQRRTTFEGRVIIFRCAHSKQPISRKRQQRLESSRRDKRARMDGK